VSSLASSSATNHTATGTTPGARTAALDVKQPAWRTHRVLAVVGIALVTGSFIASGPLVAAAAAHRPTRPAELRGPHPGKATNVHHVHHPLDDAGASR